MAYNYEYPYVDPARYNDDWLINKVKELADNWAAVEKEWSDMQSQWAALKQYILDNISKDVGDVLKGWLADGTIDNIIKNYLEENGYLSAVYTLSDILSSSYDFKTGLNIVVYSQGFLFACTVSDAQGDISYPLKNGKYITLNITKGTEFNAAFYASKSNLSEALQELLNSGYTSLYFPAGVYSLALTLPAYTHIRGDKAYTSITGHNIIFTLTGDNITIEDLYIFDPAENVDTAIILPVEKSGSFSTFRNLHLNSCATHFYFVGSCIWSLFENVRSESARSNGLFVYSGAVAFNNNQFINCRWNHEKNPIVIDVGGINSFGVNFNTCNIEFCTGNMTYSGVGYFNGCYFEGNTDLKIKFYRAVTLLACSFINEKNLLDSAVSLNQKVMVGCYQYNSENLIDVPNNFNLISCNFE